MKKIYLYTIILTEIILHCSCSIKRYEQFYLPENMSHLKPQLFQKIYNDSLSQYRLAILPIVKNKDNTGVYAFTESSAHRTYYNIFMFNGKDIVFSNIEQDVALLKFLENYSFSKCKQKLLIKRIQKIKQHNQEIHDSQIF